MLDIKITKTTSPKAKPTGKLGFGKIFTDHMFLMNYTRGKGWHDPRIEPFHDLTLSPACMVFHYGQEMFEGLKAYKAADGSNYLFRPDMNAKRTNNTNDRLCIPQIPVEDFVQAVKAIVSVDQDWIPTEPGTSLYIRPFIIATEPFLGVDVSETFLFMIILSPSGAYYESGLEPVGIWIEDEYVRAVRGGMGFAKTGGNYAASILAGDIAEKKGYEQVLWLDGKENKYIEEVGSMNMFFKFKDALVTPPLLGSILGGITRDSIIKLAKHKGIPVDERRITVQDVFDAADNGTLEEAFGSGTAAVVSPVGRLAWKDREISISGGQIGKLTQDFYDTLTGIQYGEREDPFGWVVKLS